MDFPASKCSRANVAVGVQKESTREGQLVPEYRTRQYTKIYYGMLAYLDIHPLYVLRLPSSGVGPVLPQFGQHI